MKYCEKSVEELNKILRKERQHRSFVTLLLVASVSLNVAFIAGCETLHDTFYDCTPCKYCKTAHRDKYDEDRKKVVDRIAKLLHVKCSGLTANELSGNIEDKLKTHEVPNLDKLEFEEMSARLNPGQKARMKEYEDFISDLQGKRVIVIGGEED